MINENPADAPTTEDPATDTPTDPPTTEDSAAEDVTETGVLSLSIDVNSNARTILPSNINWSAFAGTFEITILETTTSESLPAVTRGISNLSDPIYLETGTYNVTVTAYQSAGTPVAQGNLLGVNINVNTPAAHVITMRAIIGGTGTGTFRWEIGVPAVDSALMVITQMDGTQVGSAVTLTSNMMNTAPALSLTVGYYMVIITLERLNHAPIVRRDVLHVYQNRESFFKVDFTDNMFTNILYTVTFNYNYKDAGGDDVIGTVPVTHGNLVTAPAQTARTSYVFDGWYIDNNTFSNGWNFTAQPVIRDTTLYAKWLRDLAYADIQIAGLPLVYDGTAHTPAITVTHDGDPLTAGTHYSVSYDSSTNTNAGTSSVTITAMANGDAAGFRTVDFAINRADPTVAAAPSASAVTPGSVLSSSTLTGGTVNGIAAEPNLAGTWAWQDGAQTVNASGSFTAVFTPVSGNYNAVTVSVNVAVKAVTVTAGGVTTGYDNLTLALNSITAAGDYTVTLFVNQTLANRTLSVTGANITLAGAEGMREISHNGAAGERMFIVNAGRLTLENDITLRGHASGTTSLVQAGSSGALIMQGNCVITGHTTSSSSAAAVNVSGAFEMQGGTITGNTNTSAASQSSASGGVLLDGSSFTMSGGSITGNTHSGSEMDVVASVNTASTSVTLSGDAAIGALQLQTGASSSMSTVFIEAGWSGTVSVLHLMSNIGVMSSAVLDWINQPILRGASGYSLTSGDVQKFLELGLFKLNVGGGGRTMPISPAHFISDSGTNIGRLIFNEAYATVELTAGSTTTLHLNLEMAFRAITAASGNSTVTLLADQEYATDLTATNLLNSGVNITLVGSGGMREISHNGRVSETMFTINNNNASLTLGDNITLNGRADSTASLINITIGTLTMQSGSMITGHITTAVNGAVNINGANARMIMNGGIITGNHNSTDTSAANGGITAANGTLTMNGGSVTGNTQGAASVPSDVYVSSTAADSFTISGNTHVGALKLNATSASAFARVNVGADFIGSVGELNLRGNISDMNTVISYYDGNDILRGAGAHALTAGDTARFTLGNFITSGGITQPVSDTHRISVSPANMGRLIPITVTVTAENGVTTGYDDLTEALDAINAKGPGNYTVTLTADQTLESYTIGAGVNITFVGVGGERTIQRTGAASSDAMFIMNVSGSAITLGNNIIVRGRNVPDQSVLVTLTNGTFTMQEGSKITGHNTSDGHGIVNINGANGNFVMNGGEITGNHTSSNATSANGGITVPSGTLTMNGGSVTGNTQEPGSLPADICVFSTNPNSFIISGNAQVGALKLNATSNTIFQRVNVGNNFTGKVDILHLRGSDHIMATNISFYRNNAILQAASGHTLTAEDVAKFTLGDFMSPTLGAIQPISPDFFISDSGATIGRLLPAPILIYDEDDLRRVGTGESHNDIIWSLNSHYILMENITLTGDWTPIGGGGSTGGFAGVFDGNGNTITSLTFTFTATTQGMFRRINERGIVQNLGLVNVNISGGSNIGGIVGDLFGTITNCFVSGSVSGSSIVGGIAGGIAGDGVNGMIANSYSIANVSGNDRIGGIVGRNNGGRVINCYSTGNITSSYSEGGGIVGQMLTNRAIIENSYATGTVSGTGLNTNDIGGITGNMSGTVRNCVALNRNISTTRTTANSVIARVSGNTAGTRENNYGRSDMLVTAGGTIAPRTATVTGNDGAPITSADWHSASWWQNTALFDPAIWELTEGRLPRLLNMPGGLDAQNPVVVP